MHVDDAWQGRADVKLDSCHAHSTKTTYSLFRIHGNSDESYPLSFGCLARSYLVCIGFCKNRYAKYQNTTSNTVREKLPVANFAEAADHHHRAPSISDGMLGHMTEPE